MGCQSITRYPHMLNVKPALCLTAQPHLAPNLILTKQWMLLGAQSHHHSVRVWFIAQSLRFQLLACYLWVMVRVVGILSPALPLGLQFWVGRRFVSGFLILDSRNSTAGEPCDWSSGHLIGLLWWSCFSITACPSSCFWFFFSPFPLGLSLLLVLFRPSSLQIYAPWLPHS